MQNKRISYQLRPWVRCGFFLPLKCTEPYLRCVNQYDNLEYSHANRSVCLEISKWVISHTGTKRQQTALSLYKNRLVWTALAWNSTTRSLWQWMLLNKYLWLKPRHYMFQKYTRGYMYWLECCWTYLADTFIRSN